MNTILTGNVAPLPATHAGALRHIKQLDALRAFAVGSVMVAHYFPALNRFGEWGAMGVNLFFVISGFLITEILLKCKKEVENGQSIRLTLRQFYARRFLRIFPLYYLVISLSFLFNFSDVRHELWWYLTYTVNYYGLVTGKWIGLPHFWTLALEEQFYLLWPLVILLVPRRCLLLVPVIAILIAPATRALILARDANPFWWMTTPVCLDTLGFGALLAVCHEMRFHALGTLLSTAGLWIGLPLLIVLKVITRLKVPHHGLGIVVWNIAIGLFCLWLVNGAVEGFKGVVGRTLEWRPLRFLGTISYGLYVFHVPVILIVSSSWLTSASLSTHLQQAIVWSLLTIVVGTLSWYLFEHPINRWKRFFPYRVKSETYPIKPSPASAVS
jgi:peptidoglycan/LPS O-acetylase OafA/YrhL